jgi:hypothetical protein
MNVTRDEALQALKDIDKAGGKVSRFKGYHHSGWHFVVWGLVWLVANTVTQFWPEQLGTVWIVCLIAGVVSGTILGTLQGRTKGAASVAPEGGQKMGLRIALTAAVLFVFIFCLLNIAAPESGRQINAMISIVFPFMYMAAGLWAGWRLLAIGAVTAAAIMFGYYYVQDWFDLWMGVFGGGSLIAGGLWLRSA